MKNSALLTALALGVVGFGVANAQPPQDGAADAGDKGSKMFTMLDSDDNGSLSADELKQMRAKMAQMRFDKADTNGDGSIDQDEFMAQANKRAEAMFKHMDKNDDGSLDSDEARPPRHGWHGKGGAHKRDHDKSGMSQNESGSDKGDDCKKGRKGDHKRHGDIMKRLDTDGNGSVSRAEWDAGMQKMHDRHHGDRDAG
ncbi:EF-hand domain-containing protein [Salinisphaera aquimarina]|uniref:EF-hand domain-containing protein n=1 Tax=Salinisphaera aquimarina TaxID=2094031 RepID=A0ABV7EX13_9GAMM